MGVFIFTSKLVKITLRSEIYLQIPAIRILQEIKRRMGNSNYYSEQQCHAKILSRFQRDPAIGGGILFRMTSQGEIHCSLTIWHHKLRKKEFEDRLPHYPPFCKTDYVLLLQKRLQRDEPVITSSIR